MCLKERSLIFRKNIQSLIKLGRNCRDLGLHHATDSLGLLRRTGSQLSHLFAVPCDDENLARRCLPQKF